MGRGKAGGKVYISSSLSNAMRSDFHPKGVSEGLKQDQSHNRKYCGDKKATNTKAAPPFLTNTLLSQLSLCTVQAPGFQEVSQD